MPRLGAQPSHIGLRIIPIYTDDGVFSGLRKPWRMPIGAFLITLPTGLIGSITAIGVWPICLRHKLSILISRHVKFGYREPVSNRDQVLRYRVSAKIIHYILTLFFPRRSSHNLTTGSNNIDIGNVGVAAEAGKIRIGTPVTHTATLIAGIYNVSEGGTIKPVYINSNGRLDTQPPASARRFKKDIKAMEKSSEAILGLQPVTFRYKNDSEGTPQFGLIAEEVAKVNPDLVVRDDEGKIYSVRYDAVNAMLLNEFLKEHRQVQEQKTTIAELKSAMAQQQKQIKALTAGLQKVSAQIEASKPAPQVVKNP